MDVAKIIIRTKYCLVLNKTYNLSINDNTFAIKVVEDLYGPIHIALNSERNTSSMSSDSGDSSE